jgi:two-component system chemotaxis response regulator CheB
MVDAVVVDDSHFMRVQIRDVLEDGGITVVDEARNGKDAVDTVQECNPDVVTMDVKMPGMDGIEAVKRIMKTNPTPILMLSRYTDEGGDTTFEALEAGAVDFFMKPDGEVSTTLVQYADDLVEATSVAARADVSTETPQPADDAMGDIPDDAMAGVPDDAVQPVTPPTVVIGASTGGPPEIQTILSRLPSTLDCRVLIVQHMPGNFTGRFAERLNTLSEFTVREAEQRGTVGPGEVVVAKGGYHLVVTEDDGTALHYELTEDEPVHNVRPAADVAFESVSDVVSPPLLGIVLTGMGRDGAVGAEYVAHVDGTVIVQEPADASISAMPERAIETGVVDHVLPTRQIPQQIVDSLVDDS